MRLQLTRLLFTATALTTVMTFGSAGSATADAGANFGPVNPFSTTLGGFSGGGALSQLGALNSSALGFGSMWGASWSGQPSSPSGDGSWSAARDAGSLYTLESANNIQSAWSRGYTGSGITVAVIDTGIAPVAGLDGTIPSVGGEPARPKVVNGPDLSFDAGASSTRYLDEFGHGTHLAGIIAGRDPDWNARRPSAATFAGIAPDAQLLNVKVGAADGGADVTQVIAALSWVTQHRRDNGMNVRVISLAYGTESVQPWQVDPLAHAVESAWRAGIVVVTAAGNDGTSASRLLMPAADPTVIAVGAEDAQGTPSTFDDTVADFSNGGSSARRPDLVAPGRSLVSLRVPGSYADLTSPAGRVDGDASGRFFRGSGTSQATAFVAGEVALLLQARPRLTPDQVKTLLTSTARPLARGGVAQGAGVPDVTAAASAILLPGLGSTTPAPSTSDGTGSIELSRGGEHVVDPTTGLPLVGEVDVMGDPWNGPAWAALTTSGASWTGGSWNGSVWTGDGFDPSGTSWSFVPWAGATWAGVPWSTYSATPAQWQARSWRSSDWSARSWREETWQARSWRSES